MRPLVGRAGTGDVTGAGAVGDADEPEARAVWEAYDQVVGHPNTRNRYHLIWFVDGDGSEVAAVGWGDGDEEDDEDEEGAPVVK